MASAAAAFFSISRIALARLAEIAKQDASAPSAKTAATAIAMSIESPPQPIFSLTPSGSPNAENVQDVGEVYHIIWVEARG
jgi:hypothetical protein